MQFKIPQDVQREDRIIWFLTLKQLIICAIGGVMAYGTYTGLSEIYVLRIALIPTVIIALLTLAVAFLSIRNIPFYKFILLLLENLLLVPKRRVWQKGGGDAFISITYVKEKSKASSAAEEKKEREMNRREKIKGIIELLEKKNNSHNTNH